VQDLTTTLVGGVSTIKTTRYHRLRVAGSGNLPMDIIVETFSVGLNGNSWEIDPDNDDDDEERIRGSQNQ
jgi:hypothetical protein